MSTDRPQPQEEVVEVIPESASATVERQDAANDPDPAQDQGTDPVAAPTPDLPVQSSPGEDVADNVGLVDVSPDSVPENVTAESPGSAEESGSPSGPSIVPEPATTVPETAESAVPESVGPTAGSPPEASAGGLPMESDAPAEAQAKPRIQLNPTLDPTDVRPVPSIAGSGETASVDQGPVEVPAADDADVEQEIAKAITGQATEGVDAVVTESGAPVEIPKQESIDQSIEAAIEAAMTETESKTAASDTSDLDDLRPGQKLKGTVQSVHGDSVFLDFGLRLSGVVPVRQFGQKPIPGEGETIEVNFDRVDEQEGLILSNLPRGTARVVGGDWTALAPEQVVECMVTKTNKGGLEVNVGNLRGFVPASQVELGFAADLESYVGQKITAQVIEVKPEKRRLVLSRRKLLAVERAAAKEALLVEIRPDQIRTGRVKTIKDYGAFIDLGGMDGFLPISQMSWIRIEHPSEVLSEGQEIEVKVLSIDREKNKISLGMRQLTPNPWRVAEDKYASGSTVTGRVTRVETFGAFVELEPGIEGLVHISELDHRRVKRVTEVLNVDDMAEVQVLEVDPAKKRISLSVKALKAMPEPVEKPKDEDLAPGQGQSYARKRKGNLKGGIGGSGGGGLFGNPQDFAG